MTKKILMLLILILAAGCTQEAKEPVLEDFVSVLETSKDFQDYSNDFKELFNKEFEPELETAFVMHGSAAAEERKAEMEKSTATSGYASIYENLPDKKLHEVWIFDKQQGNRGIVAILDMEDRNVLNFVATIRVELNGEFEINQGDDAQ
jgi:hypothetical protein